MTLHPTDEAFVELVRALRECQKPVTITVEEYKKERLERIATAVLAGLWASGETTKPTQDADAAVRAARALISELDKEEPR